MSIEQKTVIDRIEVVDAWFVQVRTAKMFLNNGEFAGRIFHSHVIAPGDDYSNEDARVQAVCAATHTPDVINAYKAAQAAQD